MKLLKKDVYKYLREILQADIKEVTDISGYNLVFGPYHAKLPNVIISDNEIMIKNFTKYRKEVAKEIKQLEISRDTTNDQMVSFLEVDKQIADLKLVINQMEVVYKNFYSLATDGPLPGRELVQIEGLLSSESESVTRELISQSINLEISPSDYSIKITAGDIIDVEYDGFNISKLTMYSEIRELDEQINNENKIEIMNKVPELFKVSIADLIVDLEFFQIVERKKSLKPTIEDYDNIIESIGDDEVLDEASEKINNLDFDENELYLPYPANDQQKQIAAKLLDGNVAVQGPPGTGKTHTIVNIISHMLARGKSILVVSEKSSALSVIHNKMPEKLQPLVLPMLGSAQETRKHTENSVRHMVSIADNTNIAEEELNAEHLIKTRKELQEQLQKLECLQIDSYMSENSEVEIYGQQKRLITWIKSLDMNKVQLNDCLKPEFEVDRLDITRLLNYDQELLHKTVEKYVESKYLLSEDDLKKIIDVLKTLDHLTLEQLAIIPNLDGLNFPQADNDDIERGYIHWNHHPDEFAIDRSAALKLAELDINKTKYMRVLTDNSIELPEDLSLQMLGEFILALNGKEKIGLFTKLKYSFIKQIKINGVPLPKALDGVRIINCYYQDAIIKKEIVTITNRFNTYFNYQLSSTEIVSIVSIFEKILDISNVLKDYQTDIMRTVYEVPSFELVAFIKKLDPAINIAREYIELKSHIESEIEEYDQIRSLFSTVNKDLDNLHLNEKAYTQLCELITEREQKYASSVDIKEIKNKLDSHSPSLYSKLISSTVGPEVIDNWDTNYIYSVVNSIKRDDYLEQIELVRTQINQLNVELVETLASLNLAKKLDPTVKESMQTWMTLINKIGKGTGSRALLNYSRALVEMEKIKGVIPVWITTRDQVVKYFEYNPNSKFDLIIYDESSQSSLVALNVLERAHQKLIVGDDKQISPTQFINHDVAAKIRSNHFDKLEHSLIEFDTTLFDYASAKYDIIRLREHFRCLPQIIKFSNDLQYNGEMIPLRSVNSSEMLNPVVESVFCENASVDDDNQNIVEARKVVSLIAGLVEDEKYANKSIGVITLLSGKQEELITNLLYDQIGLDTIHKHNIKIANSYTFQGDERDVIILSMITAKSATEDKLKAIAMTKATDYRRFNVAASRARDKMILVHSITSGDLKNKQCVRYKLLSFFENFESQNQTVSSKQDIFDSSFIEEVYTRLTAHGYNLLVGYSANGYTIDLVVEAKEGKIAIDCDGENYASRAKLADELAKVAVLERAGWEFYRIRGRDYYANKEQTIKSLVEYLISKNLNPLSSSK